MWKFTALKLGFKAFTGFFNPTRLIITAGVAGGLFAGVMVHLANDRTQDAEYKALLNTEGDLLAVVASYEFKIAQQNARMQRMNDDQLESLERAAQRIKAAQDISIAVSRQSEIIAEELEVTRFNLVEAIRDDEDFADWVDWTIPSVGWDLLRDATTKASPDASE